MREPHEVLGVAENATPEEVAEAHRRLMLYSDPADALLREEIAQAKVEMIRKAEEIRYLREKILNAIHQSADSFQPINPVASPRLPLMVRIAPYLFVLRYACGAIATVWLLFLWEWPLVLIGIGITFGIPIVGPFMIDLKFRYILGVACIALFLSLSFSWKWPLFLTLIGISAMLGSLATAAIRFASFPTATTMNQQAKISNLFLPLCGAWFSLSVWSIHVMRIAQTYAQDYASHEINPIAVAIWAFAAATSPLAFLGYFNNENGFLSVIALAYLEVAMIISLLFGVWVIIYVVTGIFFIAMMLKLMRE